MVLEAELTSGKLDTRLLLVGAIVWRTELASYWPLSRWYFGDMQAYIMTIGVIDELRGRGLARGLLEQLELAEQPRLTALYLHVIEFNEPAQNMYSLCGFTNHGLVHNYYTINQKDYNAYFWRKEIRPCSGLYQIIKK